MARPVKPKALKMPKKPKATASVAVWERYDDKCKAVIKKNNERQKDYQKAIKSIETAKKKKELIIKKYAQ